jgi:hypothetical protein
MRAKRIYAGGAIVGLLIMALSGMAFGQADTTGTKKESKAFPHGKWGIQAQLGNPFLSRKTARFDILVKYHTSANTAWRIGADIFGSYFWTNGNSDNFSYSDSGSVIDSSISAYDSDDRNSAIDVAIQLLKYSAPNAALGFYWGLGPDIFYRNLKGNSSLHSIDAPEHQISSYRISKAWGAGLTGAIGAEYFPMKRISFTAEYSISALYTMQSYEVNSLSKDTGSYNIRGEDRDIFNISANNIEFGMTVYF